MRSRHLLAAALCAAGVLGVCPSFAAPPAFAPPATIADFADFGTSRRSFGIAAGDFDEDGYVDVVASIVNGNVAFVRGNGDGTFQPKHVFDWKQTFFNGWAFAAGEVNGDNHLDVVWGATAASGPVDDGEVRVFLGNGDGTFLVEEYFVSGVRHNAGVLIADAGFDAGSVAAADVDGDFDADVVVGALEGTDTVIKLLLNQGGSFVVTDLFRRAKDAPSAAPIYFPAPGPFDDTRDKPWGLAFGDADGDGDADLWVGDRALYVYLFLNDGMGGFAIKQPNAAVAGRPEVYLAHDAFRAAVGFTESLGAGDVNGDGLAEPVLGLQQGTQAPPGVAHDGEIVLDLSGGGGHAVFGTLADIGTKARGVTVADVNADGFPDILSGNYEGQVVLLRQFGDADGDGVLDEQDPCTDRDGDGYGDPGFAANTCPPDNCPAVANPDQTDYDGDGVGDVCDSCPADPDNDADGDLVCGDVDNCPADSNADQADADLDGAGDACDACTDTDGDGWGDPGYPASTCATDNCPAVANPGQEDVERDAVGDACDNCRFIANADQADQDMDGAGDACSCPEVPDPVSQGYWHRQCLGVPAEDGGIDPGNGRGPRDLTEAGLPGYDWRECPDNVLGNLLGFLDPPLATCDGLDADPPNDPCERAFKQLTALVLNTCTGHVSEHCPIDLAEIGCASTSVGDLLFELAGLISQDRCKLAASCADAVNNGMGLYPEMQAAPIEEPQDPTLERRIDAPATRRVAPLGVEH